MSERDPICSSGRVLTKTVQTSLVIEQPQTISRNKRYIYQELQHPNSGETNQKDDQKIYIVVGLQTILKLMKCLSNILIIVEKKKLKNVISERCPKSMKPREGRLNVSRLEQRT